MVYNKSQQRLFLLRKLKSFEVSPHVLELVYRGLVESILSFNIITWFGHLTVKQKTKLGRVVNMASKLTGQQQRHLSTLYDSGLARKAFHIFTDPVHTLNLAVPLARKNTYKKSFVPTVVAVLNAALK